MEGFKKVSKAEFGDFIRNHSEELEQWNQTIADCIDYKTNKCKLVARYYFMDDSYWVEGK